MTNEKSLLFFTWREYLKLKELISYSFNSSDQVFLLYRGYFATSCTIRELNRIDSVTANVSTYNICWKRNNLIRLEYNIKKKLEKQKLNQQAKGNSPNMYSLHTQQVMRPSKYLSSLWKFTTKHGYKKDLRGTGHKQTTTG